MGCTTAEAAVGATSGSATGSEPQTPKGVLEDVLEEPEVASEPVPKVVPGEVPTEGAMIAELTVTPSPSHGESVPSSSSSRIATTTGIVSGARLKVVLGYPAPYASGTVPMDEAVSTAHWALS
jgi:hypothetical protein